MSNNFDWESEYPSDEELEKQLKEVESTPVPEVEETRPSRQAQQQVDSFVEELLEDEEIDDREFLTNARLRLEQGRLYEMLLKHDLFAEVDSDPRAIANVQRELKNYIQERLEVLLGLRPDPRLVKAQVEQNLPFNSLEISLLKSVVSKMSGGATERPEANKQVKQASEAIKPLSAPKSDTIKPISTPKSQRAPVKESVKQEIKKAVAAPKKAVTAAPAPSSNYQRPDKPLAEWTEEEKIAHNKHLSREQAARKAHSAKALPMPSYEQQYLQYGMQASKAGGTTQMSKLIQRFTSED